MSPSQDAMVNITCSGGRPTVRLLAYARLAKQDAAGDQHFMRATSFALLSPDLLANCLGMGRTWYLLLCLLRHSLYKTSSCVPAWRFILRIFYCVDALRTRTMPLALMGMAVSGLLWTWRVDIHLYPSAANWRGDGCLANGKAWRMAFLRAGVLFFLLAQNFTHGWRGRGRHDLASLRGRRQGACGRLRCRWVDICYCTLLRALDFDVGGVS